MTGAVIFRRDVGCRVVIIRQASVQHVSSGGSGVAANLIVWYQQIEPWLVCSQILMRKNSQSHALHNWLDISSIERQTNR